MSGQTFLLFANCSILWLSNTPQSCPVYCLHQCSARASPASCCRNSEAVASAAQQKARGGHNREHLAAPYESFATVGEIRVYWRADFKSGSRVLKKVF